MKIVKAKLRGVSPMSQSRMHDIPRAEKETHEDHERRTWRERCHSTEVGEVFVPPMALKMALSDAAAMLSMQIPGKGKATYRKHFEAGVLCVEPMKLGFQKDTLEPEWINANADGVRGSGKRVKRCYPKVPEGWIGEATFLILDETITAYVFEKHLREAGSFVGLGRFRPRNGGYYGRFVVEGLAVADG